jgi:hypothetical protein
MKTETKIQKFKDFLSTGNNELFKVDSNPISLSVLFDIEFSPKRKTIGFSKCLKVNSIDEVIKIMESLAKNISKEQIREKVYQQFDINIIARDKSFYLIIKGNKLKRKNKSGL